MALATCLFFISIDCFTGDRIVGFFALVGFVLNSFLIMAEIGMGIVRPKDEGFAKFVWNSEKGEFLGRTGLSWGKC